MTFYTTTQQDSKPRVYTLYHSSYNLQ